MIFTQFSVKQEFIGMSAIKAPEQEIKFSAYMKMIGFQIHKELSQTNKRKFTYIMKNEPRYMVNRK